MPVQSHVRPLVLGLAAVALCVAMSCANGDAFAQISIKDRIAQCATCHGDDGNSKLDMVPSLAGQPEFFLLNQLFLLREGVRRIEPMTSLVKDLKDDELQAIAAHYSRLPPKPSGEKIDPELVKKGEALSQRMRCASCHLPTLEGQEQMPRLARQRIDYMIYALKSYRDNERQGADTAMTAVVVGASDADFAALAHYAAQR